MMRLIWNEWKAISPLEWAAFTAGTAALLGTCWLVLVVVGA